MKKTPDINLADCSCCQGCGALCPGIFRLNPAGYMEVAVLDEYPEEAIDEAISKCPEDCLSWLEQD
jgi:ferredoxin